MSANQKEGQRSMTVGNELTVLPTDSTHMALSLLHGGPGGLAVEAPFAQKICLVPHTRVAETGKVTDIDQGARSLREGDTLRLVRQKGNLADAWAIQVFSPQGHELGFVPRDVNQILARLLDGGKHVFAEVVDVSHRDGWWRIEIAIYLDD